MLFVARNRYRVPLSPSLSLKWDALARVLDVRVSPHRPIPRVATRHFGSAREAPSTARASGCRCPPASGAKRAAFRPHAIVAQSPFEAAAALLARTGVPVIVELHGDWRTFGRLYGSPGRRALARVADAVGTWAVRHAAKVRAVSPYTERLAQ